MRRYATIAFEKSKNEVLDPYTTNKRRVSGFTKMVNIINDVRPLPLAKELTEQLMDAVKDSVYDVFNRKGVNEVNDLTSQISNIISQDKNLYFKERFEKDSPCLLIPRTRLTLK